MKELGIPIDVKNQTWSEFFSNLTLEEYDKIKDIPNLKDAIKKQDKEYELGATFGQSTRILETPFRIMDLAHFVDNKKVDAVQAILEQVSNKYDKEYLLYYAETMGKNLAGFMNLGLAYNNWAHRQDFSLSAEMCDDAYDDVNKNLEFSKNIDENDEHYKYIMKDVITYYNQIYLFASNMKNIEDAYKITGKEIPQNYMEKFIDSFMENVEKKEEILKNINEEGKRDFDETLDILGGRVAKRNFEGYEKYISKFKELLNEKIKENAIKKDKNPEEEIRLEIIKKGIEPEHDEVEQIDNTISTIIKQKQQNKDEKDTPDKGEN